MTTPAPVATEAPAPAPKQEPMPAQLAEWVHRDNIRWLNEQDPATVPDELKIFLYPK